MEDLVGAYRIDDHGNIVPDENDEAMAARHGLKRKPITVTEGEQEQKSDETNTNKRR